MSEFHFLKCPEHGVAHPNSVPCPMCAKEEAAGTIPATRENVKKVLDERINHWRTCDATPEMRANYVSAYQDIWTHFFREPFPPEEVAAGDPETQEASA